MATVTITFSVDHPASCNSACGIDHTPRVISEGNASKMGHLATALKIHLTLLAPLFQDELDQLNKDLGAFV